MSQAEILYPRLGELIEHLLRALVLAKTGWRMGRAMGYIAQHTDYVEATVYRWREGQLRPPDETIEKLAQLGKEEVELPRSWGEEFLRVARHPNAIDLVNRIWGTEQIREIPNNLPPPTCTTFVGRQSEISRLLELLSPRHAAHLISVDGIGGVGKTALVLDLAYRCLRASTGEAPTYGVPTFDAIVFVSAKQEVLTPGGILYRTHTQRTLHDIFAEIANTLKRNDVTLVTFDSQPRHTRDALSQQDTLLVVDNMETMEDKQGVIEFLYDLPPQIKVLITSRERTLFAPIRLEQLPEEEGIALLQHEAREKNISLDHEVAAALYQRTGGVPVAMIYAVGQLSGGYSHDTVLSRLSDRKGDVARFCFESLISPLREQPAHYILMAMSMFPVAPLREAVSYVAGLASDPIVADEGFARLQQLSLIRQQEIHYSMLPLTREFALSELKSYPEFEKEARERWVKWYLEFAKEHGGSDWQEWYIPYDKLEEEWNNLLAVLDWCASKEKHVEIQEFWQGNRINSFTNIYGHWSDRVAWLGWLVKSAEKRNELAVALEAMSDMGWTLALMGDDVNLAEAQKLLGSAWHIRKCASSYFQAELANNLATLRIRQHKFDNAMCWLKKSETFWKEMEKEEGKRFYRQKIATLYYSAEIHYKRGEYGQAKSLYEQMSNISKEVGWQRASIYAQNWLADIAINLGELRDAEHLLRTGLLVVERNREKRRTAYYKHSFARLEKAKGNLAQARNWANEALDGFDRLGMEQEVKEVQLFLDTLDGRCQPK